jgi:hypothetical protein
VRKDNETVFGLSDPEVQIDLTAADAYRGVRVCYVHN